MSNGKTMEDSLAKRATRPWAGVDPSINATRINIGKRASENVSLALSGGLT